jgi:hypothetical protein
VDVALFHLRSVEQYLACLRNTSAFGIATEDLPSATHLTLRLSATCRTVLPHLGSEK